MIFKNKLLILCLLASVSILAKSAEYIEPQVDYIPPVNNDNRDAIPFLYAYNENAIQIWQALKNKCLGDVFDGKYSGKEFYEKKLPKFNKDLKVCYKERYKEELTEEIINRQAEDAAGGVLMKGILDMSKNIGTGLPRNYKEILNCNDFTRSISILHNQVTEATGYPKIGWCQKLK